MVFRHFNCHLGPRPLSNWTSMASRVKLEPLSLGKINSLILSVTLTHSARITDGQKQTDCEKKHWGQKSGATQGIEAARFESKQ